MRPHAEPPTIAQQLGRIAVGADAAALSPPVLERLRLSIVDNLGTLAFTSQASRDDPFLGRVIARGGKAGAQLPGRSSRLPYEDAAAAFAYLLHFAETDESDLRAQIRASPAVIGPALALAQHEKVTGRDLAAAIALGFSVQGGLGAPFGPTQDKGLMSAGVFGPAAAAAVASRLLRLSAEAAASAISLATLSAGGLFQYYYDQTEEKRLVVARAARAGVESALIAADGAVGARRVFEGEAGLFHVLDRLSGTKSETSRVVDTIARLDGPLYIYPKFFAASTSITPSLEGLWPYVARGLRADKVERFVFQGDPEIWIGFKVLGPKFAHFEPPRTLIGANMHYLFMVAFMLVHGVADAAHIDEAALHDEAVLSLARMGRVEIVRGQPSRLLLRLKSGETLSVKPVDPSPSDPVPAVEELRDMKFSQLAEASLGVQRAAELKVLGRGFIEAPSAPEWTERVFSLIGSPAVGVRP